jgi:hypothetical protein
MQLTNSTLASQQGHIGQPRPTASQPCLAGDSNVMTQQPNWQLIANLGDAHPIDHGGLFVSIDTTGVYAPEAELLVSPDDDSGEWTVYRFSLDQCTFVAGVLSDNKFHPDHAAWFAKPEAERANRPQDTTYLSNVASCMGMDLDQLREWFCSANPIERAMAYQAVGDYHGFENLDGYPLTFKDRSEVEARYPASMWKRNQTVSA